MKKVITSIISLVTMTSLLVGAPKKDIVDTAVEAGSFKTLVTAVHTLLANTNTKWLWPRECKRK